MSTSKRAFALPPEPATPPGRVSAEDRRTSALEFIAYYLDRIDGHLERLADAAERRNG